MNARDLASPGAFGENDRDSKSQNGLAGSQGCGSYVGFTGLLRLSGESGNSRSSDISLSLDRVIDTSIFPTSRSWTVSKSPENAVMMLTKPFSCTPDR